MILQLVQSSYKKGKSDMKRKFILLICIYFATAFSLAAASNSDAEAEAKRLAQQAIANPDYRVLPGDIYQLGYTIGQTPVSYQIAVDASGIIRVSNLGSVNTNGKTFLAVKKQVEALVAQNYPLSVVQFVLTAPSAFTVTVKGEVSKTTEVKAWGLMRASQAITGLLTDFASNRYFSITGRSGKTVDYDLFKAIRDGDLWQDPYLSPGDVISIPRVKRRVTLSGAVERPGVYELDDNETLNTLIERYGNGFTVGEGVDKAQVKIVRIKDDGTAIPDTFFVDMEKEGEAFSLLHKDTVYVEKRQVLQTNIYIEVPATVSASGQSLGKTKVISVAFVPGDDFVSLIRQNMQLFTTAVTADTSSAYIFRQGKQLPVNLNKILFDAAYNEHIPVEPGDRLIVPEIEQTVTVNGAVTRPGEYPYTPGRKVDFYIALAGGFDYQRNSGGAVVIRDVYGKKLAKDSIIGPNTIITAKSNAFMYNFNFYVPLLTVTASMITAVIAILTFAYKK